MTHRLSVLAVALLALLLSGCNAHWPAIVQPDSQAVVGETGEPEDGEGKLPEFNRLTVTASAYNSLPGQTDSTPAIAAWGDKLQPGMKAIAVSRDLLDMGLTRHKEVRIKGLPGTYRVLDKMHHRWKRKIDIYMGENRRKAINWGKREVEISWAE